MRKIASVLLILSFALVGATSTFGQDEAQNPHDYLDSVLRMIEENAVYAHRVEDWDAVRAEAFAMLTDAQTTADTYPAIEYALKQLGDRHSFLMGPEEGALYNQSAQVNGTVGLFAIGPQNVVVLIIPDSPAAAANIHLGDKIIAVNGESPTYHQNTSIDFGYNQPVNLTLQRGDETWSVTLEPTLISLDRLPEGRVLADNVGYIALYGMGLNPGYAQVTQNLIADQISSCGWIIDLRQDIGGGIYPMLAGIGPILGEGPVGTFVDASGQEDGAWSYQDGHARLGIYSLNHVSSPVDPVGDVPVAVLTSPLTGSAGEAVLISFIGRPNTRTFGAPSAGLTTGNSSITLSDGAVLVLATAYEADRNGIVYDGPIAPDELVDIDWAVYGTEADPVIQAARGWLYTNYECGEHR